MEEFITSVPRVAVDMFVLQPNKKEPNFTCDYDAIIIRRLDNGMPAVIGGMLELWEELHEAAIREVMEETNVAIKEEWIITLQPRMFTKPRRDPRGSHTISAAFTAVIPFGVELNPIPQLVEVKEVIRVNLATLHSQSTYEPESFTADHAEIICTLIHEQVPLKPLF